MAYVLQWEMVSAAMGTVMVANLKYCNVDLLIIWAQSTIPM